LFAEPMFQLADAPACRELHPHGMVAVDRSQPDSVSSKTTAAATSAADQAWSAAPWQ